MDDLTLKIDTGAPVEVPAFEPDECGHNWLAVNEDRDPRAPGGLRRRFQPRAGVPFYYLVEGLKVGDVTGAMNLRRTGGGGRNDREACHETKRSGRRKAAFYQGLSGSQAQG